MRLNWSNISGKFLGNNFDKCKVLINKSDAATIIEINEIYKLGVEDFINISASNKLGFDELYNFLKIGFASLDSAKLQSTEDNIHEHDINQSISVAIVGRPNAGKSTLFNGILQESRAIVSEVSGTTRDSINHQLHFGDDIIEFIDTAGLRKRKKITDIVENYSVGSSITSIRRANVIILLVDATLGVDSQELKIAGIAQNEGKPLIVILNKVDLLSNRRVRIKEMIEEIRAGNYRF